MPAGRLPKGEGKAIIFSAPSGAGKSTMVSSLMASPKFNLGFSVSATTRKLRGDEVHGESYYFISQEEFACYVAQNEFVEWEEVYPGLRYGTLCSTSLQRVPYLRPGYTSSHSTNSFCAT